MYSTIDNMLDHLMNDLAEDNKKAVMRRNSDGSQGTTRKKEYSIFKKQGQV
jgi:hypothetical protein